MSPTSREAWARGLATSQHLAIVSAKSPSTVPPYDIPFSARLLPDPYPIHPDRLKAEQSLPDTQRPVALSILIEEV